MQNLTTSQNGINLIKQFEGFSSRAYICPAGYLTIGFGHVVRGSNNPLVNRTISLHEAEMLLRQDLITFERIVNRLVKIHLNQNQFDALVSFTFNLGGGNLEASTLLRLVNRGKFREAANQFERWVYGGGRKLKGLIARRKVEKAVFLAQNVATKRTA